MRIQRIQQLWLRRAEELCGCEDFQGMESAGGGVLKWELRAFRTA
jgi:hypothetical protein